MKSWKTPTPEQISRAIAQVAHVEHYRYFFDRLENPNWVRPLKERGFFSNPPEAQRNEAEGTISFPPWPESKFLSRMAAFAPDIVHEVALGIPETENISVHQDIADVSLALPARLATDFVPKAKRWLETRWLSSLPRKFGELVAHLAKGGQVAAALELARELLSVRPKGEDILRDAKARFDWWEYEQILSKYYPRLIEAAPEQALQLLLDLVDKAIRIYRGEGENDERPDYSQIWIPSLEPHEQSSLHDVKELLVLALRESITRIVEGNPTELPRVVAILDQRKWWVFERLTLYLLRCFPGDATDMIRKKLTDRILFDEGTVRREYGLLAEKCFALLREEDQTTILGWIENDPEQPDFRQSREANLGRPLTDEELEQAKKRWRVRWLRPMRDSLPLTWRKRYDDWAKELGEPDYPELAFRVHGGAWEPSSPKTEEDLRQMSTSDLVKYLKTWESAGDPMHHPSRSGLAQQLATVIDSDVERFAREATQFIGLDPTYVRTLLGSFRSAAVQNKSFDWKPVLELLEWIVDQPQTPGRKAHEWEQDPDWGWSRRTIADLLSEGFKADTPLEMPFEYRGQAWDALLPLTHDPDPTPEEEARHWEPEKQGSIPHHTGVRGDAMNTVVQYALWVWRQLKKEIGKEECQTKGFSAMPEVQLVLDGHLDPENDPSIAIRAVYGRWFPWLHYLDRNWGADNILKVFPREKELKSFRQAAWDAYVLYCPPYNEVLEIVKDEYRYTVDLMEPAKSERESSTDTDQRLTEHLVLFYGRGKLDLSEDGLVAAFFKRAREPLRAYFLEYAGRTFEAEKDLGVDVLNRFEQLWTWRLELVRSEAETSGMQTSELASFDWWFSSGRFENGWALRHLTGALRLSKQLHPSHRVLERLARVAEEFPVDAVTCLAVLVEKDVEAISLHAWSSEVRSVIRTAIDSGDASAREAAIDLIHKLGARGFFEFRNLLPS